MYVKNDCIPRNRRKKVREKALKYTMLVVLRVSTVGPRGRNKQVSDAETKKKEMTVTNRSAVRDETWTRKGVCASC